MNESGEQLQFKERDKEENQIYNDLVWFEIDLRRLAVVAQKEHISWWHDILFCFSFNQACQELNALRLRFNTQQNKK